MSAIAPSRVFEIEPCLPYSWEVSVPDEALIYGYTALDDSQMDIVVTDEGDEIRVALYVEYVAYGELPIEERSFDAPAGAIDDDTLAAIGAYVHHLVATH